MTYISPDDHVRELTRAYNNLEEQDNGQEKQILVREAMWRLFRYVVIEHYLHESTEAIMHGKETAIDLQKQIVDLGNDFINGELTQELAIRTIFTEMVKDGELKSITDLLAYDAARIALDGDIFAVLDEADSDDKMGEAYDTYELRLKNLEEVFPEAFQKIVSKIQSFRETQRMEYQDETKLKPARRGPDIGLA